MIKLKMGESLRNILVLMVCIMATSICVYAEDTNVNEEEENTASNVTVTVTQEPVTDATSTQSQIGTTQPMTTQRAVAPPIVHAELIGRLLRVTASNGFYQVEAVYVNDVRFTHRVDSALVLDVGEYIAAEQTIVVYALDFDGNKSNVVMITPPDVMPKDVNQTLTPDGTANIIDVISDSPMLEHFTFQTKNGNFFHLLVDRNRDGNQVYLLNQVSELELLALSGENVKPTEAPPPPTVAPIQTEAPRVESTPAPKPTNSGATLLIPMGIIGAIIVVAYYFLKIKGGGGRGKSNINSDYDDDDDDDDGGNDNE